MSSACACVNSGVMVCRMAPEMLRCEPFDERADVYSFGVCLWEILTGDVPWANLHAMQVMPWHITGLHHIAAILAVRILSGLSAH